MTLRHALALALAAPALALGACGGGDDGGGDTAAPPAEGGNGQAAAGDGRQLFTQTCGGCHTLADAGTQGSFGPSLDERDPDRETVLNAIANGPGAMPANLLQGPSAEAVADYVAENAGS
jgi:mono/diheme cytochrome c family protein